MLLDKVELLKAATIILASGSPRRRELLTDILKLKIGVVPSTFEENLDKTQYTPESYVRENARQKALEVWNRLDCSDQRPNLVIGSDTVVVLDGDILEKPKDKQEANRMLSRLSGREHMVYTGVALVYPGKAGHEEHCFSEGTAVTFATLTPSIIQAYVDSGDPMDKAGSYGIQTQGGSLVSGINGCFYNVVGFPLNRFCTELSGLIERGCVV